MQQQSNPTPLSGTGVTINDTAPTGDRYNLGMVEVLAVSPTVPDLTVAKTHSGSFVQGQTGAAYTITVKNIEGAVNSGTVTQIDRLHHSWTTITIAMDRSLA